MRLGTTSYIYPADILTNVRALAGSVMDVELVIFECDEYGSDLPDTRTIEELIALGSDHDLTYTVHLPLDLRLADPDPQVEKALRVMQCTKELSPEGFIVHLDGVNGGASLGDPGWTDRCLYSLGILAGAVRAADRLCVENLEDQHPEQMDAILGSSEVSCCVDVGHLWKKGLNPWPCLERWLPRARVVHLHGVGTRDHKRLSLMPQRDIDRVLGTLHGHFSGVITLEVFNEDDLKASLHAVDESIHRLRQGA